MKNLLGVHWKDLVFYTPDKIKLHGWLFRLPGNKSVAMISHGNGGNIFYCLPMTFNLLRSGVSVFMYDYEGYGSVNLVDFVPINKFLYPAMRSFNLGINRSIEAPNRFANFTAVILLNSRLPFKNAEMFAS